MFASLLLVCLAGASPSDASLATASPEPRAYHAINTDLRDAIRREAVSTSPAERAEGVRALARVYREIVEDPRLADSPTLKEMRAKGYSRLIKIKGDLEKELAREERLAKPVDRKVELAAISLSAQMGAVSYSLGGPAAIFTEAGEALGGGAGPGDHGEVLVSLIEKTISPDSWDVNGGPGSIIYYAPLKVLVISATGEVHGNVGGVLDGLRRAGN